MKSTRKRAGSGSAGACGGEPARPSSAAASLVAAAGGILLAIALVGAGFIACALPPTTHLLAQAHVESSVSPFSREQLVAVADATRSYAFGKHDADALTETIYAVNVERAQTNPQLAGAPRLSAASLADAAALSTDEKNAELATGDARFSYDAATRGHLDDCARIARIAYPVCAACGAGAVALLSLCARRLRARSAALACAGAGAAVIAAFACAGIAASVDFNTFFDAFHHLFFSQGSWEFPYDSLLICALPTGFWIGMGGVWLATTLGASILCVLIGRRGARLSRRP